LSETVCSIRTNFDEIVIGWFSSKNVSGGSALRSILLEHFDEKRAITPKWVMGFTSKLQGRKILTCCKFLQFKLTFISYSF
jgi:hypothetical protein